jgi:hypothetical protein
MDIGEASTFRRCRAIPAGTAVRNAQSGDTYNYAALSYGTVPNTWTQYQATISGPGTAPSQFRPGTAYVRMLLLPNFVSSDGNLIAWRDVEWTYAAPSAFHAGDTVELHSSRLDFAGPLTYQWSQLAGPPVAIANPSSPTASVTLSPHSVDYDLTFQITTSDGAFSLADTVTLTVPAERDYTAEVDARALLDAGTFAGQETYQRVGAGSGVLTDGFVPVDVDRSYLLSGWARSGDEQGGQYNPTNRQYFRFASYDVDQLLIEPAHVLPFPGAADTRLAAAGLRETCRCPHA